MSPTGRRSQGFGGPRYVYVPREEGLPRVDADTALALDAYWACVSGISDDLAGLPWRVFRKLPGGGRTPAADHPADWLLSTQANSEMTAFEFRQTMFQYALTWGNAVAEIETDLAGRPRWLWPIEPWRVRPDRVNGSLVYRVANPGRVDDLLDPADVLHIKGLGDGLWGYSILEFAARSLGIALVTDRHAARSFANDGRPGGVIEMEKAASKDAIKRLEDGWHREYAGKPGRVPVLEQGSKFKPVAPTSPQDAELLASRKFSGESICRWFKYPQHKAGFLDRATFNNIEELNIDYTTSTLLPWAVRAEQQANLKLFGLKQRGEYYTKLGLNGLMRGNAVSRADFYARMVERGLMHPDEARELEDLNPIPKGLGKEHFVPVNWQTLDRAVNPPAPTPPPAANPPAADDPSPASNPPAADDPSPASPAAEESAAGDAPSPLAPVFREAAGRVLRREAHRSVDATRRHAGDPAGLTAWEADFLADHRGYVVKAFTPAAVAAGLSAGVVEVVLAVEADEHCRGYADRRAGLAADADPAAIAANWEADHAGPLADRVMSKVMLAAKVYGA